MELIERWRAFERRLTDKGLGWALHHAPAQLRQARLANHPRGAAVDHLLPADYRAFVAAVGYPVIGFSSYDHAGFSFLPPETLALQSLMVVGEDEAEPQASVNGPTQCSFAFFAGNDLSDMVGWAFAPPADGGEPVVWYVEGTMAREEAGTFSEWLTAALGRLELLVDAIDAEKAAEMAGENDGERDPHRLIDYSLDKQYDVAAYSAEDLRLSWVMSMASDPYAYGLIDDAGKWRIPLGKGYLAVKPFRDGIAEVVVNKRGASYGGPWTRITTDGTIVAGKTAAKPKATKRKGTKKKATKAKVAKKKLTKAKVTKKKLTKGETGAKKQAAKRRK
jgi:hypothetical protein